MRPRQFIEPDNVALQLQLPTNRTARAHNRQVEEKIAGVNIRRKPGRPARKVKSATAITHQPRPKLGKKEVLHLTLKMRRGLPNLRRRKAFNAIRDSFCKYSRGDGFRMTQFSVQGDHVHLIAEADSKPALSRAMQKLGISIAKRLAFVWKEMTPGRIYKERYHARSLTTPTEVRHALLYVLHNGKKHGIVKLHERDFFSSAHYFDGFAKIDPRPKPHALIADATAWLLTRGWRRLGLIRVSELPKS